MRALFSHIIPRQNFVCQTIKCLPIWSVWNGISSLFKFVSPWLLVSLTKLHIFNGLLVFLFCELPIHILCSFPIHIPLGCPLSDVSFVNIFSQSMASLIILLILSFAEHNFLILMKSTLLFLSWIVSLVLYLSCHHSQGHLGFLLCYLLGVL